MILTGLLRRTVKTDKTKQYKKVNLAKVSCYNNAGALEKVVSSVENLPLLRLCGVVESTSYSVSLKCLAISQRICVLPQLGLSIL